MTRLLHKTRGCLQIFTALSVLFLGGAPVFGQINIPDTPAGHTLQALLDAFNSGDRTKIQA
jgi:hypothetical protein